MREETDGEAIQRSLASPAAFEVVFERWYDPVHRYAARRVGQEACSEIASETFLVAFRSRARFDPSRESALPWLLGIATNLASRHHRRESGRRRAVARTAAEVPATDVLERSDISLSLREPLARALRVLKRRDLDVLILFAWEDLSYEDVAVALEIPVGTVRSRLNRARRALRRELRGSGLAPGETPFHLLGGIDE